MDSRTPDTAPTFADDPQAFSDPAALRERILALSERYAALVHGPRSFVPGKSPVPVSGRVFGPSDVRSLLDSSLDFWLTAGRFNTQFEKRLGRFLGVKPVLTVNSGTSATLVAFAALPSSLMGTRALNPSTEGTPT